MIIIEKMMQEWKNDLFNEFDLQPAIDEMGTSALLKVFLDNIGNLDSLTRENVAMAAWTLFGAGGTRYLSDEEFLHAINIAFSETHLFKGIDGGESDDAFMRGFASLFVRGLMTADCNHGFLSQEQYEAAFDKMLDYMMREKDRRSFVYEGKGIIHAVSHGASALMNFIDHPRFAGVSEKYVSRILDVVKHNVVCEERFAAVDWADNKIAEVITNLMMQGINEDAVKTWIEVLMPNVDAILYTDTHYTYIKIGTNIEHFLMCLYFALKKAGCGSELGEWIVEYLPKLRKKVYS
ncbi:MAG: DUF2785 domain-containing protein [Defluviitaleaceae bacterium]|nr:DUF2785 domain-containing protein [Defluviitaleaceae bacterium]